MRCRRAAPGGRRDSAASATSLPTPEGTYAAITLATKDLDGVFERLRASGAEVMQEPTDQPYGVRDCAFRDPAGDLIRINELR